MRRRECALHAVRTADAQSSAPAQRAAADAYQAHRIVRGTHGLSVCAHFFDGFRLERQMREALLLRLILLTEGSQRYRIGFSY